MVGFPSLLVENLIPVVLEEVQGGVGLGFGGPSPVVDERLGCVISHGLSTSEK